MSKKKENNTLERSLSQGFFKESRSQKEKKRKAIAFSLLCYEH
ncbi:MULTISPECIES: hypothetical protein [Spirulina sp. CCY15215]|nr:hypothetical protein [Spirulina major]